MSDPEIPENYMPPLEVVATAYADVVAHNNENTGLGAGLINLIKAMGPAEDDDAEAPNRNTPNSVDGNLERITAEGDMKGELQGILHEDTFTRIGIGLAPLGSKLEILGGASVSSKQLMPMINNAGLFTDFLGRVNPEEIQQQKGSLALITDVISTLQKTVIACYGEVPENIREEDKETLHQYGEDALRAFDQIDGVYKVAGLDKPAIYQKYIDQGDSVYLDDQWRNYRLALGYFDSYKALENFVTYWGRGVLPEYVQTGPLEYLAGAKIGYLDGGHHRLIEKTDYIVGLTQVNRTKQFGLEAAEAMLTGIERTSQKFEEEPSEWYSSDSNKELLTELRTKLKTAISSAQPEA